MAETTSDLAIISEVSQRSTSNITDIKNNLKTLEDTLNRLTTSRESLIDAIVSDAAEAINYWQNQVRKTKNDITIIMRAFMVAISAQEKTIASLGIINTKYAAQEASLNAAATAKTYRQWPARWGTDTNRLPLTGDVVNVDTGYGTPGLPTTLPPDYGTGTGQTTGTPYTEAELRSAEQGYLSTSG